MQGRFYDEESIVTPPVGEVIDGPVLVVFEDRIMELLNKQFELSPVGVIKECAPATVYRIQDKGIYVYQTPIGAPATAIFMERSIALGAKKFLFFGSCGGLVPEIGSGKLIVPTSAYCAEGTSSFYAPIDGFTDMEGSGRIMELMDRNGLKYISGKVCSTDAMFRETKTFVESLISKGCIGIEMECSLISTLSKCRKVFAASILFTDDVLSEDSWSTYEKSAVLNHDTIGRIVSIVSEL